jgi:hypothetical protein
MASPRNLRWVYVAAGIVLAGLATAGLYRFLGPVGLLLFAPAWGALLALPLLDGVGAGLRLVRWTRWFDVQGRYYEHRGRWIDIVEDDAGQRFVRIAHVRLVLPGLPADATFAQLYADRVLARGTPALAYLRDDALLEYLARSQSPDAAKLHRWLYREVALPGRNRRERAGR